MKKLVIGILAHVDAGKTTLSEGLLYKTGTIRTLGRVDHRNTFLDTHELERARGITIFSKQAQLTTDRMELTLLDTPGHADFSAETERAMQVLDCAILVISGTDGVQAHTETLWALLEQYQIPTFVFVTKMDVSSFSRAQLMDDLRSRLSEGCMDMTAPQDSDRDENLAMLDETLLDLYMTTGRITDSDITGLVRKRALLPCYFGSGLKLEGLEDFLDGLARFAPAPATPDAFGAKVFKIAHDTQGNRLTMVKLTGGTLSVRSPVRYLPAGGEDALEEKITQLRLYSGQKYETVDTVSAGSVCALLGLSATRPGQGLGIEPDSEKPFLEPALGYQLILPKGTDTTSLLPKLKLLEDEDPLLRIIRQPQTGEIQLQLMGAVQIEVLKSLIRERFDLDVGVGAGRILYRETIRTTVEGIGHYEPLKHYAEVHLLLEPGEPGSGLVFDTACSEDELALNWQRLILTHLGEKTHLGVLTGSPITDMRITLVSGKAHLKHTEGGDFRQATYRAVRQGLMQAESVLLEPYFEYRLEVPADQLGRAISDIRAMDGEHSAPESRGERMVLTGTAPVSTMTDYLTEVMAYTRGRGRFSCHVAGCRPCHNTDAVLKELDYDPAADRDNTPDSVFCAHGAGMNVKWSDVPAYMHLDSVLARKDRMAAPAEPQRVTDIDERELEAIMTREFGPIRRPTYTAPVAANAIDVQLSARKKERLIVDGYNVIFAWDDLKALAADNLDLARTRLEDMLANYQGYTKSEVVLVFDAYKVPGGKGSRDTQTGLHIAYTKQGESADMYIEHLVGEIGKNESVRVVTSDALIRLSAMRSGVLRTGSREFRAEVDWVLERISDIIKETQK